MSTNALFKGVSPGTRDALERRATLRRFARGESLFDQGGAANELFLITKGRVKVWRASEDGTALTLTLLGGGAPIGTLGAADDTLNHATATALTPVEAMAWHIDEMRRLMDESPPLTAKVLRTVTNYDSQLIERRDKGANAPVERRLARTQQRMAERTHGMPAQND